MHAASTVRTAKRGFLTSSYVFASVEIGRRGQEELYDSSLEYLQIDQLDPNDTIAGACCGLGLLLPSSAPSADDQIQVARMPLVNIGGSRLRWMVRNSSVVVDAAGALSLLRAMKREETEIGRISNDPRKHRHWDATPHVREKAPFQHIHSVTNSTMCK